MRYLNKQLLVSTTLAVSLVLGGPVAGFAQSAPAAAAKPAAAVKPATEDDTVSDVTVTGKAPAKAAASSERTLRLDTTSAASCNFTPGSDTYMQDFLASMRPKKVKGEVVDGVAPAPVADDAAVDPTADQAAADAAADNAYFSETTPLGDASQDASTSTFFARTGAEGQVSACSDADKLQMAGRASIARRDKTLPEGFRLYDAHKLQEAMASFKKGYAKLPDADGGIDAALMIGKIYLELPAGERNVPEAITWLKKAADAKFSSRDMPAFDPKRPYETSHPVTEAAALLGKIYLTGFGVPRDMVQAAKWYGRAEEVGYVPGGKIVGDIYYYGYGMPKDLPRAVKAYKAAATLGFVPAEYALAEILYTGEPGLPADPKTAIAWYNEAAKSDHPGALFALASAYDVGEGVPADPQKALGLYKSAALAGSADAQTAMGTYFYEGDLVAKDHATARKWFESAARRGNADAMFNLGAMLMKGEGGDVDMVKAWMWFTLAKARGHENAPAAVAAVYKRMTETQRQEAAQLLNPKRAS